MTLPPVVDDPEGPCPNHPGAISGGPHGWKWTALHSWKPMAPREVTLPIEVCRFCGGRKP